MSIKNSHIFWIILATFLLGCSQNNPKQIPPKELAVKIDTSSTKPEVIDTLISAPSKEVLFKVDPNIKVQNWHDSDFVVSCESDYFKEELIQDMGYYRGEWASIKSPIIATYMGNEFGDYFHIIFEDDNNNSYDFGFGNNDFSEFELFKDGDSYADNPKYLNKKFKVHWQWEVSGFPCCSGEYYFAEAYMPSIVRLELIEE